jgi:hypothetical protein
MHLINHAETMKEKIDSNARHFDGALRKARAASIDIRYYVNSLP